MKKLTTIILSAISFVGFAQTYSGGGETIPTNGNTGSAIISVCNSDGSDMGSGGIEIESICIDITQSAIGYLDINLIDPCGQSISLYVGDGSSAQDNLTSTCFHDAGANGAIGNGTAAPYTGTWIPEGGNTSFSGLNDGNCSASGDWQLEIVNSTPNSNTIYDAVVNGWSINFTGGGSVCQVNDACADATPIPTDGISGCISGSNVGAGSSGDPVPTCWNDSPDNTVWYSFVPDSTSMEISLLFGGTGLMDDNQVAVYSGTCGSLTEVTCNEDFNDGLNDNSWVQATNLTVGSTYYVMVDGNTGSTGGFSTCITNFNAPPTVNGQDCFTSTTICDETATIAQGTVDDGFGTQELITSGATDNTCFGGAGERESVWYNFTVDVGGTFEMNIDPDYSDGGANGTDVDWSIYNLPTGDCSTDLTLANQIECNWSGCLGATGTSSSPSTEPGALNSGPGCGGSYAAWDATPPTLTAGETYAILIDNFSTDNLGYELNFGGTVTFEELIGTCLILELPLNFIYSNATTLKSSNQLNWKIDDYDVDYFVIEKSKNGTIFNAIKKVKPSKIESESNEFTYVDKKITEGVEFYRVRAVKQGEGKIYSDILKVERNIADAKLLHRTDLIGRKIIDIDSYNGIYFNVYDNGINKKQYK